MAIVYEIITKDLLSLKPEIEKIIKEKLSKKIFDIEELNVCQESKYHKFIEFEKIK